MTVFGGKQEKSSKIDSVCAFPVKNFVILAMASNMYSCNSKRGDWISVDQFYHRHSGR